MGVKVDYPKISTIIVFGSVSIIFLNPIQELQSMIKQTIIN